MPKERFGLKIQNNGHVKLRLLKQLRLLRIFDQFLRQYWDTLLRDKTTGS
jgi:hypothetical protein